MLIRLMWGSKMKLKSNIREFRMKAVLSQRELAEKLELSRSYMSEIENGKKIPRLTLAYKISTILKVDVEVIWPNEFANDERFC